MKSHVSLSHIKICHGYDFLLYFPHELLMNFRILFIEFAFTLLTSQVITSVLQVTTVPKTDSGKFAQSRADALDSIAKYVIGVHVLVRE